MVTRHVHHKFIKTYNTNATLIYKLHVYIIILF
jgi:hypothetical protein